MPGHLSPDTLKRVSRLATTIGAEATTAHAVIDMALASITLDRLDTRQFAAHSLYECVADAIERYPFQIGERGRVTLAGFDPAWRFHGSDTLLVYVIFNLTKNALYAISARKGIIQITTTWSGEHYIVEFRDSADGIPAQHLGRIFDPFFSTKNHGSGSGMGLTFCRRVMSRSAARSIASRPRAKAPAFRCTSRACPRAGSLAGGRAAQPRRRLLGLGRLVEAERIATVALGLVERGVSAFEQHVQALFVGGDGDGAG